MNLKAEILNCILQIKTKTKKPMLYLILSSWGKPQYSKLLFSETISIGMGEMAMLVGWQFSFLPPFSPFTVVKAWVFAFYGRLDSTSILSLVGVDLTLVHWYIHRHMRCTLQKKSGNIIIIQFLSWYSKRIFSWKGWAQLYNFVII